MKRVLLIATGGTISSRYTEDGLSPALSADELIRYLPRAEESCGITTVQPFSLDSTNMEPRHWLELAGIVERSYEDYDGFVICHGTDTMAFTAAALSYLIQGNRKPVVLTGAQKPIDLADTDARKNLGDSIRLACDGRASGTVIVFDGQVIAGTRAKKERSKSYNAFSSINFPPIAAIQEDRIAFYIRSELPDDASPRFFHELDTKVFLLKLIPGDSGAILDLVRDSVDAVIIEYFGVGGLPDYGDGSYSAAIAGYIGSGRQVVMATQVAHEGSDMSIYEVGKKMKARFDLPETYDMTLEACVTKTMWALAQAKRFGEFKRLFYTPINHDLLFSPLTA